MSASEMSMLQNCPNSDGDDEPHTLHSTLQSRKVSGLSLISSSLQISQSPTGVQTNFGVVEKSTCPKERMHLASQHDTFTPTNQGQFSGSHRDESKKNVLDIKNNCCLINKQHSKTSEEPQAFSDPQSSKLQHERHAVSAKENSNNTASYLPSTKSCSHGDDISFDFEVTTSQEFFTFVILHASEDQDLASRVCCRLQDLDIGKGTTFCDGFEIPGISPLSGLERAIEDSAYILLLLTNNFLSKWGIFQANTVLMSSIRNVNKFGSVIPFYPRSRKATVQIPLSLASLIPLDENSSSFESKVKMTFKQDEIRKQYKFWKEKQKLFQETMKKNKDCLDIRQLLRMESTSVLLPFYGQTPIIHINNPKYIQVGNQNSINIQMPPIDQLEQLDANATNGPTRTAVYLDEPYTSA